MDQYEVIIIGAGPAGCAAALYCGRAELKTVLIEKMSPGGQMATTSEIENYPGFPKGIDGPSLAFSMLEQAERFGVKSLYKKVESLDLSGPEKIVNLRGGVQISAPCLILAMGAQPRMLGVPGEERLRGKGVSYCATCDGAFFRNKTAVVVGGGDTAAEDAVFLSKICKKVYLVHRRDTLRAARVYYKKLEAAGNVEFLWDSALEEIQGEGRVEALQVKNLKTGECKTLEAQGVFVAVGVVPGTELVKDLLETDPAGYVLAGEDTKTSIPGVFVCGDIRKKPLRQIVTATADGAVAAYMAGEHMLDQ